MTRNQKTPPPPPTTAVTIRIPVAIERCAVEYARHHDLRSRNAAINAALEAFFRNPDAQEDHNAH